MTNPLARLWHSIEAHPWRWTAALVVPLILLPQIDLTVSGWFYLPERKMFPARSEPFYEWVRRSMPYFLFAGLGYVGVVWAAGLWLKEAIFGITGRVAAYLALTMALGPGLVVNLILKDSWGRPRPSTIREFGGENYFVPPLVLSDQCDRNCSFSSGHGALGFWPVAVALLAPPAWRPAAVAAALGFGMMVGFVRIAQGGHFLSDVVFSAIITVAIIRWLHKRMIESDQPRRQADAAAVIEK
ncbi:phosphatase PAP2 family protein [Magnetospirillum sp. UT-4]|uniref:phosphatase PAP2 family protein n=1 Tax=Magnetospirillum sp. UT-4 TaxID=2681467 RepID=UPI001385F986|nr:phosphatase PAP2 family protein [Magnetospirillum sp. UT-4]CAA7611660.1 Phosphoesterase, PA-phosphatase [Magnetospirillum sp. UT-4]